MSEVASVVDSAVASALRAREALEEASERVCGANLKGLRPSPFAQGKRLTSGSKLVAYTMYGFVHERLLRSHSGATLGVELDAELRRSAILRTAKLVGSTEATVKRCVEECEQSTSVEDDPVWERNRGIQYDTTDQSVCA